MPIKIKKYPIALFVFFSLFSFTKGDAQNISPMKSTIEYDGKMRPCLLLNLDPEPKTLKIAWIDFLKDEYGIKLKGMGWFSNKDLLHAGEVTSEKIFVKKMDFYTQVIEDENGSEMKVFASLGYDIYLDEEHYPEAFKDMEVILNSFLKEYLPKYYKKTIEETAERIKDFEFEIQDLKDNIKNKTKDIDDLNNDIKNDKKSIEADKQKLMLAETKLKGRQEKLKRVKGALK